MLSKSILVACLLPAVAASPALAKPQKAKNKFNINHIVVVMMENRSFDHLLGWHPTANGMQTDLSFEDDGGVSHPIAALSPDFQGCSHPDPDHSWQGGRSSWPRRPRAATRPTPAWFRRSSTTARS
jgi:phospholipase C